MPTYPLATWLVSVRASWTVDVLLVKMCYLMMSVLLCLGAAFASSLAEKLDLLRIRIQAPTMTQTQLTSSIIPVTD